jgi:hypothetical protein
MAHNNDALYDAVVVDTPGILSVQQTFNSNV